MRLCIVNVVENYENITFTIIFLPPERNNNIYEFPIKQKKNPRSKYIIYVNVEIIIIKND